MNQQGSCLPHPLWFLFFGIVSPGIIIGSGNTAGTARLTPLRPVRMSLVSQKFNTPPRSQVGNDTSSTGTPSHADASQTRRHATSCRPVIPNESSPSKYQICP
ncbi:hypothetical protein VNO77_42168 [Canavalia gladiata]|uniref:Uncharacterized protein n=1 Tax=Canavalia gladiata TaxID=3824 RepID=A0AAN9PSH2_CANGL